MMSKFFVRPAKAVLETTGYSLAAAAVGSSVYRLTSMDNQTKENKPEPKEQEITLSNTRMNF